MAEEETSEFDRVRADLLKRGGDAPATLDDLFLAFDAFFTDADDDDEDDDDAEEGEDADDAEMLEALVLHGQTLVQKWGAMAVGAARAAGWVDETGSPTSTMPEKMVDLFRKLQGETRDFVTAVEEAINGAD